MAACSILVVEDDTVLRDTFVIILKDEDLTVTSTRFGIVALSVLIGVPIDLDVLDMVLPDVSGSILVHQIRTKRPGARIPAISLSPARLVVAQDQRVDAVLAKPSDIECLVEFVTRLCSAEAKPGPFRLSPSLM